MKTRMWFGFFTLAILAGCAPKTLLRADCHSCTVDDQEWSDFSWNTLEGKWKGSVETWKNQREAKSRAKHEKAAELQFLGADAFLKARGVVGCTNLPANAVVLNGVIWGTPAPSAPKEFEAFVPVEDGKVAYGRVGFEKMNGKDFCQFRRYGRVMGKNRLDLPSVSFTDRVLPNGRVIASSPNEKEISVEFLRLDAKRPKAEAGFRKDGRGPASKAESERPALMIRVFQSQSHLNGRRGELSATDEQIYRLWKTN